MRETIIGVLKLRALRRAVRARLPHPLLVGAHVGALLRRQRIPPGMHVGLNVREQTERTIVLTLAKRLGPIFKAVAHDRLLIYVVGLPLARRLLREHVDDLQAMSIQVESLVPGGFMREMQGDMHRQYRRSLMRAVVANDLAVQQEVLRSIAQRGLREYAGSDHAHGNSASAYVATLSEIATGMLITIVFGVMPGTAVYDQLMQGFHALGPDGLVWSIGDPQREAFAAIRTCLRSYHERVMPERPEREASSILERLHAADLLDETMLGNLIYMVEMGRFDTRLLFRWLSRYAAEHTEVAERIAADGVESGARGSLAEAFVLETLRTDQSERLLRLVQRDMVFEGYFIPRHSIVRICMWESHHSEPSFPEPLSFQPERFQPHTFSADQFSPFGLDQHQCPFANVAMTTSLVFLRTLLSEYTLTAVQPGEPIRGRYHWEPAHEFSVRLSPRATSTH